VLGGLGSCERISVRRTERAFPRVGMKRSMSRFTFLRRVAKEMKIILLL
jgi:hypothetical protein